MVDMFTPWWSIWSMTDRPALMIWLWDLQYETPSPQSPSMRHLPPVPRYESFSPKSSDLQETEVCHDGQYDWPVAMGYALATIWEDTIKSQVVQLHVWTLNLEGHIHILVNREPTYSVVSPLSPRKLKRVTAVKRLLFKNLHRVRINFGG